MRFSFISLLAAAAALPCRAYAQDVNALELIKSQPDLKLLYGLLARDPFLADLYTNLQNATIFGAVDSTFPSADVNDPIYSDFGFIRRQAQNIIAVGEYPADAITTTPQYVETKLRNETIVNTSAGVAIVKLYEIDGKKVLRNAGVESAITTPDLRFNGGILHKTDLPLRELQNFTASATFLQNDAVTNLSALGLLTAIEKTKDVTLFTITNEAFQDAISKEICLPSLSALVGLLEDHVVYGGVYFADSFDGRAVETVQGGEVVLSSEGGELRVNEVKVVVADISVGNGVYHILEKPLTVPGQ